MKAMRVWHTPLCPAGHLPLKGGDRSAARSRQSQRSRMEWWRGLLPISPLEGEMPGRAEGGKPHPPRSPQ
ncbi:MAG: lytic murein transglycosylase [Agrobacterium fabrum]|uniref:Lytic murein transglycosylase n=1 Tax=Agrobacterium fabrum TaxID=1176649 RepID=A0A2W5ETB7_9HYPH|nr:MAG: lytic murein transglycosylase [Agrobacterium fabrum]